MRPLRALLIYIAVVFLGGALLGPWLCWLARELAPVFPKFAQEPFHRYVNRSFELLALAGLWPLLRALGATSPRDIGLSRPSGQLKPLGGGFIIGFLSLAVVTGLVLATGARHLNESLPAAQLARKLLAAAATAAATAIIEEILFRGALFGSLRKVFDWRFALLLSSAVYALVHFLDKAKDPETVTWFSGLRLLPGMLHGLADGQTVVPRFLNLTMAGMVLGVAYQRTGTLYCSVGLHAGWIFWLKSYGIVSVQTSPARAWWWGTDRMIDGWLALPVLVATLFLLTRVLADRDRKTAA